MEEKKRERTIKCESSSSTEKQSSSYIAGGGAERHPMEGNWAVTGKTAFTL